MFKINDLIHNGENLIFRKYMGELFRTFWTDNNVVGPVATEHFVKKEFKRVAGNIDITVANAGLNTVMEKKFKFVRRDRRAGLLVCFSRSLRWQR
ncbi:hypothetical protein [Desulfosporosinus fructosivorans]